MYIEQRPRQTEAGLFMKGKSVITQRNNGMKEFVVANRNEVENLSDTIEELENNVNVLRDVQ